MKSYYNVYLANKRELTECIVYADTPVEAKNIFGKLQELKDTPPSKLKAEKLLQIQIDRNRSNKRSCVKIPL